jgi:CheY-like chemotaxis protein
LVVDDYVDGAEMLTEILQANGHEVRMAHDAASALEIVTGFSPQVACLDIAMPVVDGYQLAVQLRAIPGLEDIRLIAVSGFGREQDRQKSREAGFAIHLVKPIDLAAVEAAIHGRSIG